MRTTDPRRRRLLLASLACGLSPLSALAKPLLPTTPRQTAGPFYPPQLPLDDDNDLTRVDGQNGRAAGRITDLSGRVLDRNGRPLHNARLEIWQCDANGRYRHPWDRGAGPIDPAFQGHGSTFTDAQGYYRFRTIRPVPYPGRTPHIHAAVFPAGGEQLVTQIYVGDEPGNAEDMLFRHLSLEQQRLVTADFQPVENQVADFTARFDFVLGVLSAEG